MLITEMKCKEEIGTIVEENAKKEKKMANKVEENADKGNESSKQERIC